MSVSSGQAEDADAEVAETDELPADANVPAEGLGKRVRRPNTMYSDFWKHANDNDEDLEVPGVGMPV